MVKFVKIKFQTPKRTILKMFFGGIKKIFAKHQRL